MRCLGLLLLAACFDPRPTAGAPCASDGTCPSGLLCDRGLCVDEALPDAAPDGPAIDAPPLAWRTTTPLPAGRYFHCAVELQGSVFVIGGVTGAMLTGTTDVLSASIRPDGSLASWQPQLELPFATLWHACAVDRARGRIYVVGGSGGSVALRDVASAEVVNGVIGAWKIEPLLPEPRRGLGAVFVDDTLYAIAGEAMDGLALRDTVYSARVDQGGLSAFAAEAPFPVADYMHTTVSIGQSVYAVGGYSGGATSRISTLQRPLSWSESALMPARRERHASAASATHVYVVSGRPDIDASNVVTALRAEVDGSGLGAWTELPPVPLALAYTAAVYFQDRLYVLGGSLGPGMRSDAVLVLEGL